MDPELKFIDEARVLRHLHILLNSKYFCRAPRLREFLYFVVTETLAGRGNQLKEYSIAVDVYGRRPDFDPKEDSTVRVEAVKLRARLTEHYNSADCTDGIEIRLPKGGYVPSFRQISSAFDSAQSCLINELCAAADLAFWRWTAEGTAAARKHFSRVVELAPSDPRGRMGRALTCLSAMDTELESPAGIIPCFEAELAESFRLFPASSYAHVLRSIFLCATGGVSPRVIAGVNAALRLEPANPQPYIWRGGLLSAQGHFAEAMRYMQEGICLEPLRVLYHVYCGRNLLYAGQHEHAVERLAEITRLDPGFLIARLWLTIALTECSRFDEAIATAEESVARAENSVTRSCMSYVLARAGYREDAKSILKQLLPPFSKEYVSPVWLASVFTALDRRSEATKQLESARKENALAFVWHNVDPRLRTRVMRRPGLKKSVDHTLTTLAVAAVGSK
jgi:tetratricopeptide (TPR) repeat protein